MGRSVAASGKFLRCPPVSTRAPRLPSLAQVSGIVPVACPIGRSTRGTHGHFRSATHAGLPAQQQADPLRIPTCYAKGRGPVSWRPDAGGRHRHGQAPGRGARVAGRGVPRYSHGYKTRVFTGAICPLPHETETVVSKGAPT
jgi:hypothetical protein